MAKRRIWSFVAAALVVGALGSFLVRGAVFPRSGTAPPTLDSLLNIPLDQTLLAREEFLVAYRKSKPGHAGPLYEQFLPRIGANGIRLAIETARPYCHEEAHDLGKLIFTKLRDVGQSLEACADSCSSGCMHGVLMQFFADTGVAGSTDQHSEQATTHQHYSQLTAADVRRRIPTFCESATWKRMYGPGDCAHGVGHAAMFLSNYDIPAGIDLCDRFPRYPLRYYCATGAYMEYWINPKFRLDYFGHGPLYPCDKAPYPAACFKYILGNTTRWHYAKGGTLEALANECAALSGKYRLGCFHGIGFSHRDRIQRGKQTLAEVCGFGGREDQTMCLEGAMERLGKFNAFVSPDRCSSLPDWRREVCRAVAARKKYDLDRSFALFQR
ncbi:MAG TPA: hypothetical protein VD771_03225 [Gemmatimonadaceae bacterium]|nr:hypothetical protein [Gemmatimonadaceae bacterium]